MNVRIHIERMILEGAPLTKPEAACIQAAVESELGRLLTAGGLSPGTTAGGAFARISVPATATLSEQTPPLVGRQIAGAIYRGIGDSRREARKGWPAAQGARNQPPPDSARA